MGPALSTISPSNPPQRKPPFTNRRKPGENQQTEKRKGKKNDRKPIHIHHHPLLLRVQLPDHRRHRRVLPGTPGRTAPGIHHRRGGHPNTQSPAPEHPPTRHEQAPEEPAQNTPQHGVQLHLHQGPSHGTRDRKNGKATGQRKWDSAPPASSRAKTAGKPE